MSQSAKANLKGAGILLLITVLFYWKILFTRQFSLLTGYEGTDQAYVWLNFQIHSIQQGVLPLWDPYTFAGHVFSGEMQTGAFYPLYFLLALFPLNRHGAFSPTLYHVLYVTAHFIGAYFMFLLVRDLELSVFAAVVAGACFSLGGLLAHFPEWPHLLNSGTWLPLIFLFLLRALRAHSVRHTVINAFACGCCLGLAILAGGIHYAIMQGIAIVTAAIFHCFWREKNSEYPRNERRRTAMVVGIAGLIAFSSGAIQLLPSIEYSHRAVRYLGSDFVPASDRIPYHYLRDGLLANSLLNFLIPAGNGGRTGPGEDVGPYFGVFPLLLSVVGIWTNWEKPWVRYMTGLATAAFVYALGPISLLHGLLYAFTPYLSVAREEGRFLYLADFALTIMAAYGIETVFRPSLRSWRDKRRYLDRVLKWIAVASLIALGVHAVFAQPPLNAWVALSLLLIVVSWMLFRYLASGHNGHSARILTIAIILFDLSAFNWTAVNRLELSSAKGTDEMERLLSCGGVARFLKSQKGVFRSEIAVDSAPNIGDMFQIQTTGGAAVTLPFDYANFMVTQKNLLNVRYSIRPATQPEAGAVYQDSFWKVYENPRAYPRAWLVRDVVVVPGRSVLLSRLDDPTIDLHLTALLEAPLPVTLAPRQQEPGERVEVQHYDANRIEVRVDAADRALLVLSEMDYPGWTATIDGRPAPILRVDGMLRGIVAPQGKSTILLRYMPMSIYVGGVLSGGTLAVGLVGICWIWFRRRRDFA